MKKLVFAAAATFALATQAPAQSSTEIAIMHFNMSVDSQSDIRMSSGEITMVDAGDSEALAAALANINMSADGQGDLRGLDGVTVIVPNHSNQAAEIFRRLMAEDDDN